MHVRPHPVFGRKGDNLTLTAPVTFNEAALGARDRGAHPGWRAGQAPTVRRARRTAAPSGSAARASRKRDGTNGDLLVTVEVVVPSALNDEARQALDSYAEAVGTDEPAGEAVRHRV